MKKQELRRQKILFSERSNKELYILEGTNQVYKCFELVGIYKYYQLFSSEYDIFYKFYEKCINEKKYLYRNEGVKIIYDELNKKDELNDIMYFISKSSMRKYGFTKSKSRVRVYESSAIVLKVLLEFIMSCEEMKQVYNDRIKRNTMIEYFDFQEKCLLEMNGGIITRKCRIFSRVRSELEELIGAK